MKKIGLIISRTRSHERQILRGISRYVDTQPDWTVELLNPAEITSDSLSSFDGILASISTREIAEILSTLKIPVINIFGQIDDPNIPIIKHNETIVTQTAADHLYEHMYKNFAFCGYGNLGFSDNRKAGFIKAVEDKGCTVNIYEPSANSEKLDKCLWEDDATIHPDPEQLATWLKSLPKPCGLFAANDLRAFHVICAARTANIKIPEELAVIGVDNDTALCSFTNPKCSTILMATEDGGYIAAEHLNQLIEDPQSGIFKQHFIFVSDCTIVQRDSTKYYNIEPHWLSAALTFIDDNIFGSINAGDVFKFIKRSHTLVDKTFKNIFGMPVHKYILKKKMLIARKLLEEKHLSANNVALKLGFSSLVYFTKVYATYWQIKKD